MRPDSGIAPGEIKKVDYEYKRKGTANVFCTVDPKKGFYINKLTETRNSKKFAEFIASLERRYSSAPKIVLVMDNLNTHSMNSLVKFYGEEKAREM